MSTDRPACLATLDALKDEANEVLDWYPCDVPGPKRSRAPQTLLREILLAYPLLRAYLEQLEMQCSDLQFREDTNLWKIKHDDIMRLAQPLAQSADQAEEERETLRAQVEDSDHQLEATLKIVDDMQARVEEAERRATDLEEQHRFCQFVSPSDPTGVRRGLAEQARERLQTENEALETRVRVLSEALRLLAPNARGDDLCWCRVGVGGDGEHSRPCCTARAALAAPVDTKA